LNEIKEKLVESDSEELD